MDKLGERLKQLRLEKGVTQKQISEFLEVNTITVQRFEYGDRRPSYDTLIKLCNYFNVSSDYLLGLSDDPTRH